MQAPEAPLPAIGVVFNTSMSRPDAALGLCALYGFEGLREAHLESVCVTGAGLGSAVFCDMIARLYQIGPQRNSNSVLPVGLSAADPLPPDAAMLRTALQQKNDAGGPRYEHSVRRLSDTAMGEAALRNAVTFNADSVIVLSAPATTLAASLDLPGAREVYGARVKRLVIVDAGARGQDVAPLRQILEHWPTPVYVCGKEVGEAFTFPASIIETGFGWTPIHPAIDAYQAYRPMPYDAPAWDIAAAWFAVHPDSDFFQVSETGSVSVSDDGRVQFTTGAQGNARKVMPNLARTKEAVRAFVEIVSARPVGPPARTRPAAAGAPPKKL